MKNAFNRTLKMATNSPSQDSFQPNDQIPAKHVTHSPTILYVTVKLVVNSAVCLFL